MDEQMVKLMEKLNAFAAQMGVKADELWPILVAHQWWGSIAAISIFSLLALAFSSGVVVAIWGVKKDGWDSEDATILGGITGVLAVLFLCCAIGQIPDLMYPEADALAWLLRKL